MMKSNRLRLITIKKLKLQKPSLVELILLK
nr:MAG TPA: hypothetical protein [Caudoviricetes sp.]